MPAEEKLFYTIGEVAQILEVKPYVLRYWETEVKKLNPQKSETGQRTYRKKDLQIAMTLKRLLYDEKYTIAGAIIKLDELEKEGFDQIDLFGDKKHEVSSPLENLASVKTNLHATSSPNRETPVPIKNRHFPREKLTEMRSLIDATHSTLKKYNLA